MRSVALRNRMVISSSVSLILLASFLGACSQVNVTATADSCPSGGVRQTVNEFGACYRGTQITLSISAAGAWIVGSSPPAQADTTYQCTSGYRCASYPGTCNTKACVWKITLSAPGSKSGSCDCGCPLQ